MGKTNAINVTLQAALFSVLSTAIAQIIAAWQKESPAFQLWPYLTFSAIAIVTTPPNYFYQKWLEDAFPARSEGSHFPKQASRNQLSKSNTLIKFLLDQTFGAAVNTLAFIALNRIIEGSSLQLIGGDIKNDFLSLLLAGWRFWPLVTLTNLCLVPWEWRAVVGNLAGLSWGVYLNIREIVN